MTKGRKKSSRSRMKGRTKGRTKQIPTPSDSLNLQQKVSFQPNRARLKLDHAWVRGAPGRAAREEARNIRKKRQTAARRVLRKIRKEIRQALRRREASA